MTNPHCRIAIVRPKSAPHLAEIIPEVRGAEFQATMHEHVDQIFAWAGKDGIAGYAIVVWDFKGSFNRATQLHKDSQFGHTLLPAVVAEVLRRDVSRDVAEGVLRGDE